MFLSRSLTLALSVGSLCVSVFVSVNNVQCLNNG